MLPGRFLDARFGIFVILFHQGADQLFQPGHLDVYRRAGACIAVMPGQLKDASIPGDLHEQWEVFAKAMFEIDFEAEEAEIMLPGFFLVKYPQNGNGRVQMHAGEYKDQKRL